MATLGAMRRGEDGSCELSVSEARENFLELARDRLHEVVTVTRSKKPVLALLDWDFYDSLVETLEVLADEDLSDALRKSIKEEGKGRSYTTEEVREKLGL